MIASIHSFRRGSGKTTILSSIAMLLAAQGKRVGVLDFDLESPGVQILFGLRDYAIDYFVNDALLGRCTMEQATIDLGPHMDPPLAGSLYIAPSNPAPSAVAEVLNNTPDTDQLQTQAIQMLQTLNLDMLLIDNQAGMNQNSLASLTLADRALIILRIDKQDHQGTGVLVNVAKSLDLDEGHLRLVVNEVPPHADIQTILTDAFRSYEAPVAAVLPHSEELQALGSQEIFAQIYPDHPITIGLKQIAAQLW